MRKLDIKSGQTDSQVAKPDLVYGLRMGGQMGGKFMQVAKCRKLHAYIVDL